MLIGIDGNEANINERVGVNIWAFEILRHLAQLINHQPINPLTHRVKVYLKSEPLPDLPPETDRWHYRVIPDAPLWTRWRLPLDLYLHGFKGSGKGSDLSGRSDPSQGPDVFLSLSHYVPKWAPMPRIVSIMDLSFLHFPEAFKPLVRWQLEHWTAESVRKAAHVLTISEFTKKEIVREYGYPEEKITVVYPGVGERLLAFKGQGTRDKGQAIQRIKRKYNIDRYMLFIGTLQPKKNLPRLIKAFKLIHMNFPNLQLVIAGKIWRQFSGSFEKDPILPTEGSDPGWIRYVGFVPDEDLPPIIAGAECLVLPSLYEGFGIPVLEAMALGTPVAASNATSIPEVINDCGVLFDPTDISDIALGIREVLSWSPVKRQEMVKKGMIRAQKFSWEQGAEKVLDVIKSFV